MLLRLTYLCTACNGYSEVIFEQTGAHTIMMNTPFPGCPRCRQQMSVEIVTLVVPDGHQVTPIRYLKIDGEEIMK